MQTGLDQYAIDKFAEALEVIPRIISETSGQDVEKVRLLRLGVGLGAAGAGAALFRDLYCFDFIWA